MELALLVGLADAIVDLVSTGGTLKANNLTPVEHILDISSQLIVNQAALKLGHAAIRPVIDASPPRSSAESPGQPGSARMGNRLTITVIATWR